jgi:nucleolar MIF4G domain-containing protein 1
MEDASDRGAGEDEEAEWTGFGESAPDSDPHLEAVEPKLVVEKPVAGMSSFYPIDGTMAQCTAGARYIPPALRNRQAGPEIEKMSEEQMKLQRQLKGLLNRCVNLVYSQHAIAYMPFSLE